MFDAQAFFRERLHNHAAELNRYLRYMLNQHLIIVMLFLISGLAYYYQQWLQQLPANFPAALIIGIVFGLLVSYSPVRTLLKEPDIVFLLQLEPQLKPYFNRALLYSFFTQLYLLILGAAILAPLFFAAELGDSFKVYGLLFVVLLIFKIWNLFMNWWMLRIRNQQIRYAEQSLRIVLNTGCFYLFLTGETMFAAIVTVVFVLVLAADCHFSQKQGGLAWDLLIEKDQNRMQAFYRIANQFADVPHLKAKIHKRQWLVSLLTAKTTFEPSSAFDYLYRVTFARGGDYFGLYARLTVLGGVIIFFIPNMWVQLVFSVLFVYLTGFQLIGIWNHHRTNIWLDLYPVQKQTGKKALLSFLLQLSIVQALLFSLVLLVTGEFVGFLITAIVGIVFSFGLMKGFTAKRLT